MESRVHLADERHKKGYNCAQAVACTYCDLFGMDEETAFRAIEAFGLGMGAMNGTCGAVSGAVFLAGLKNSCGDLQALNSKGQTYKISKEITNKFIEKNQTLVCKELKGDNPQGKVIRPCPGCIEDAARIVEEILVEE